MSIKLEKIRKTEEKDKYVTVLASFLAAQIKKKREKRTIKFKSLVIPSNHIMLLKPWPVGWKPIPPLVNSKGCSPAAGSAFSSLSANSFVNF